MSSKDDIEDDGTTCHIHIGADPSPDGSYGADAENEALPQETPDSTGHSSGTGCDNPSSVKSFEFDAVLVFADEEEDEKLAEDIEEEMNALELYEGEHAKACMYGHAMFGGSLVGRPQKLVDECRFVFFVLTENTKSDDIVNFTKDEAISYALKQKRKCVRYLHTQPEGQRKYVIPEGLTDVIPLNWFKPLQRCQKKITDLFCYHRKNPSATSYHQDGQKSCKGGPLRRELSRNGDGKKKEGPNSTEQTALKPPELMRITHESNMMLKKWQQELFCKTVATRKAKEILKVKGSVFILGRSGDGKTSSVYHILTDLKKEKSAFQPYIIKGPEDMDHLPPKDAIVFVDNIFGASNFSSVLLEKWRVWFQRIEAYVAAGDMYFIASSPCHIRDGCVSQISNIPLLSHIVNMAGEHSLGMHEKDDMLTEYLESKGLQMSDVEKKSAVHSDLSLGFPQCCKLYVTNQEAQSKGSKFFQKPYILLSEQIERFRISETTSEKLAYMVLVLCFSKKGKFSSDTLNPFSDTPVAIDSIQQVCGIQKDTTTDEIRKASERLCSMGFLRYDEQEGSFVFSHQSIHDAVSISFGKGKGCEKKFLELCPLDFLISNTALIESGSDVNIPSAFRKNLFDRIILELKNGEFKIFEHSCFSKKEVVNEIFQYTPFATLLNEVMISQKPLLKLMSERNLYFLTASKKYGFLVLKIIDAILKISPEESLEIPQSIPSDIFPGKEDAFDLGLNICLYASVLEIHNEILHQCLEGSCIAGDLKIFQKVMELENIKPCDACFVKAVESNDDQPAILDRLLSNDSETYVNVPLLIKSLVKMEKVKSLETVFKSVKTTPFQEKKVVELFKASCASGNYDVFQMLQKHIGIPYSYHDELLFESIAGKNKMIVQSLFTEENKNCLDRHNRTLLHHACLKMPELCNFLISRKVNHSKTDKKGFSALHLGCQHLDKKSLENLIFLGVEVTVPILQKQDHLRRLSPLHMAARNDKGSSLVDLLIQEGPKGVDMVNCRDLEGRTPLHIATQRYHGQSMIKELIKHKADHKTEDDHGKTPLHMAAIENIPQNIESLLEHDAKVNAVDKKGKTPLHYVLERGISTRDEMDAQMDSVDLLLTKGADASLVDESGNTAVHTAAQFNTPPQIYRKVLAKAGNSVDLNKKGMSPLHLVFKPDASLEAVSLLTQKYPSLLQTKTSAGKSVLNLALEKHARYSFVEAVLDRDPLAAKTVNWDDTDLFILEQYHSEQIIHILELCAYEFPPSVKFDMMELLSCRHLSDEDWKEAVNFLNVGKTFLSEKKCQSLIYNILDSPKKIGYVLSKGASVNVVDQQGNTPLHIAVSQGNVEGTKALLSAEADVKKLNKEGDTLLHVVCRHSQILSGRLLRIFSSTASLMANFSVKILRRYHQMFMTYFTSSFCMHLFSRKEQIDPFADILSILLQQHPRLFDEVKICNKFGFYPVHYSVHDKHLLDQFVSSEDDLKLTTRDGWSCLHSACLFEDNLEVVNHILDKNISPCVRDGNGITPLHVALVCGMKDIVTLKRLAECSHDKSVCHSETDFPLLHIAATYCSKEIVKMFIEENPDMLFQEDKEGHLPLHCAVAGRDLDVIRLLTDAMKEAKGRDTTMRSGDHARENQSKDAERNSPLDDEGESEEGSQELENENNSSEMLRPSTGFPVEENQSARDGNERSYADLATFDEQQSFRITEYSAGVEQQTLQQLMEPCGEKCGNTIINVAARYGSPEVLKFLLSHGFVVNNSDGNGNTPLHIAIANGRSDIVDCLLKEGAETDIVNKEDLTPLLYALRKDTSQPEDLLKLLECGVFGKTFSKGRTNALHLLCKKRFRKIFPWRHSTALVFTDPAFCNMLKLLNMLIDKGCDVNARDKDGQTPLHMAAAADNTVYVDILLDHKAEIDAVDNEGRTPLHRAVETEYSFSAAVCLVERGANPHAVVRTGPIAIDILMKLNVFRQQFLLSTNVEKLYMMLNILDEKKESMTRFGK